MKLGLISVTGLVGSPLQRQARFAGCFNAANAYQIHGQHFNVLVCPAAPGQKWLVNHEPEQDRQRIGQLIQTLQGVTC